MSTLRKKLSKEFIKFQSPFTEVHVGSRMELRPTDIVMIQADISYSFLYLSNGKRVLVSTNIQKLEERFLPFKNMVRIHRSFIINLNFMKTFDQNSVALKYNLSCPISRRKKINLDNALNY